jgi:hypothetical protein
MSLAAHKACAEEFRVAGAAGFRFVPLGSRFTTHPEKRSYLPDMTLLRSLREAARRAKN